MLECVINISEGRDVAILNTLRQTCLKALLDMHADTHHNRSVFTLSGPDVEESARALTRCAISLLDITTHHGIHPRIGIVDVVPFVALPNTTSSVADARQAQLAFAHWVSAELHIPAFLYGADRSLPRVRKEAFTTISPDFGPPTPHPTAGAVAVGCRSILIAYNLWLDTNDIQLAREVARAIRQPGLRALGLNVGNQSQVSCNLIEPLQIGPEMAYDLVLNHTPIERAELVGLLPQDILNLQSPDRLGQLDLSIQKTIEARLSLLQSESDGLR